MMQNKPSGTKFRRWKYVCISILFLAMALGVFVMRPHEPGHTPPRSDPHEQLQSSMGTELEGRSGRPMASEDTTDDKPTKRLTVAEARRRLADAAHVKDIRERSQLCGDVIAELCRAGHPPEAFGLIVMNEGRVTRAQVKAFFRNCGLSLEEAVQKIKLLEQPITALEAVSSYASVYGNPEKLNDIFTSSAFESILPHVQRDLPRSVSALDAILSGVVLEHALVSSTANETMSWLETAAVLRKQGQLGDQGLAEAISYAKMLSVFERWDIFSQHITGLSELPGTDAARARIVDKMIEADADSAIREIAAVQTDQGIRALGDAVKSWHQNDPGAIERWYQENAAGLSAAQRDAVSNTYFNLAMNYSEAETAEVWANQVADADLKRKLLDELAKKRGH